MVLLALDPSIRSSGVALFVDHVLVACTRIVKKPNPAKAHGGRCLDMARAIMDWVAEVPVNAIMPEHIAFEWPHIYQRVGGKSRGDPNDLPGLAGVGMAVVGMLIDDADISCETFSASEWKGQMPKHVAAVHIERTLSKAEWSLVPASHDVIDAVGIGLHACGRMKLANKRHVYQGG